MLRQECLSVQAPQEQKCRRLLSVSKQLCQGGSIRTTRFFHPRRIILLSSLICSLLLLLHHSPLYPTQSILYPSIFSLPNLDMTSHFTQIGNNTCYILGTDQAANTGECFCLENYTGKDCGMPDTVEKAVRKAELLLRRRTKPRRLIYAVPVNHELDMFEARVNMLYNVVDVFLVGESNFTNAGKPKPRYFLEKLRSGWLKEFQNKIIYVSRSLAPTDGFSDGKAVDAEMRDHLSQEGLNLIDNLNEDDLFAVTDNDLLPKPEILNFLKLYDGLPHVISLNFKWSIFGFFWQVDPRTHHGANVIFDPSVVTVQFFRDFYNYSASQVRSDNYKNKKELMDNYEKKGLKVGPLNVRNAGWHCSWCFHPEGVRKKIN